MARLRRICLIVSVRIREDQLGRANEMGWADRELKAYPIDEGLRGRVRP